MRTPPCPYAHQCGGCQTQELTYDEQIAKKKSVLSGLFPGKEIEVFTDNEFEYRNRMDFIFHPGGLGLRGKDGFAHITHIPNCIISNRRIQEILQELQAYFPKPLDAFDPKRKSGTFRYAVIRASNIESSISFVLSTNSTKIDEAMTLIEKFAKKTQVNNIVIAYVAADSDQSTSLENFVVKGKDTMQEKLGDITYNYSIQGFFQNNSAMAKKMVDYVTAKIQNYTQSGITGHLLDLYGGVGTFGVAAAKLVSGVSIVENFAPSIDFAKVNIINNNLSNAKAFVADAASIKKLSTPPPAIVITDPPRSGMDKKALDYLNNCGAKRIMYISCNPQQAKKELLFLGKYSITSVALFDLFPQTYHMEAVLELELK